jgi:hypothetical protein
MIWQPIETAPLDGTYVDLWVLYDGDPAEGYREPDCSFDRKKWADIDGYPLHDTPTHWMPVPEGPNG